MKKNIYKMIVGVTMSIAIAATIQMNNGMNNNEYSLFELNKQALANCEINEWIGDFEYNVDFYSVCNWYCYQGGNLQCPI